MFKVFISNSIYERIIISEGQKNVSARSNLYKLLVQQQTQKLSVAETSYLKTHPEEVLKNPSSLYILEITPSEAMNIQKSYGVMCLRGDHPNISPLIDVNDIHISYEKEKLGKGWDSVLDSVEKLPSNALLLTDRYLFAFRRPDAGDGIANIRDILDDLLPHHFIGGDYHVTIVFDDKSKHYSYTFDEIATKLNRIKMQIHRNYPIMMEVLGVTPDCSIYNKLAAFNHDKGTARQMLIPMALFTEGSLNGTSTPPLKAINQTLTTLRDFSKSLKGLSDHNIYLYAVNGKRMEKCMEIRNRLIK